MQDFGEFILRQATMTDLPALHALHATAVRSQSRGFYDNRQIDTFLRKIGTLDPQLITAGTYYVIVAEDKIVGSGGWSPSGSVVGSDTSPITQEVCVPTAAAMRSFFVSPRHLRKGIARTLLGNAEREARRAGFETFELLATLNAIPFYVRHGYCPFEAANLQVGDCPRLPAIKMRKQGHLLQ